MRRLAAKIRLFSIGRDGGPMRQIFRSIHRRSLGNNFGTLPVNSPQLRDLPNLTLGFALSSPTSFLSFCCPPLSQASPPPSLYSSRLSGGSKILEEKRKQQALFDSSQFFYQPILSEVPTSPFVSDIGLSQALSHHHSIEDSRVNLH